MWSALTRDFNELAQSIRKDSIGFVDLVGRIAADVVGHGGIYAGDEVTAEAKEMPLPRDVLLAFQDDDDTYCKPLAEDEAALFPAWEKVSPFSSVNVHKRVEAARRAKEHAGAHEGDGGADSSPSSPGDRSAEWPDEPAEESRQRLLDYSEVVLLRYTALVGEAVSPRPSLQGSPLRQSAGECGPTDSTPAKASDPFVSESASTADTPQQPQQQPSPCLAEDVFFDRYFFRLAQLRALHAERRREEREAAAAAAAEAAMHRDKEAAAADASPASTPPSPNVEDDDIPVPAFARKFMAAANDLVTGFDVVLTGGAAAKADEVDSDADNVTPVKDPNSVAGVALPRRLSAREAAALEQRAAALESVVQELQEELRKERGRVRQLTALLEERHIPVPPPYTAHSPSAGPSPAKPTAAAPRSASEDEQIRSAESGASRTPAVQGDSAAIADADARAPARAAEDEEDQRVTTHCNSSVNVDEGWEKISDEQ